MKGTLLVVCVAMGLVACGDVSGSSDHVPGSSASVDEQAREIAGERVQRYLGLNVAPSHWDELNARVIRSVEDCMHRSGYDFNAGPTLPPASYAEVRAADPGAFHNSFGYGVTEEMRYAIETYDAAQSLVVSDPQPSLDVQQAQAKCEDQASQLAAAELAPPAVHDRFAELLFDAAQDQRYLSLVDSWRSCLKQHGHDADDPLTVDGLVSQQAVALADPTTRGDESDVHPLLLSEDELSGLQRFELELYRADQSCRDSSELDTLMYDMESAILRTLQSEFPDFGGVIQG